MANWSEYVKSLHIEKIAIQKSIKKVQIKKHWKKMPMIFLELSCSKQPPQ